MARIEVTAALAAPVERVWDLVVDWDAQVEWMADVRSIEVLTPQRTGVGVVARVRTDIAFGLVLTDEVHITEWREHERLGVRHRGPLYSAVGAFELNPVEGVGGRDRVEGAGGRNSTGHGTRLVWWDELKVPLGTAGDSATALLVMPFIRRTFRRSLANLKRMAERT